MTHKIAVRVKPMKKWSDVANATRHGKREDAATHVDRSRTHLNKHWQFGLKDGKPTLIPQNSPADLETAFVELAKHSGAKWRKGAIVATEMLFIASPGFFDEAGPKGSPAYQKLARKWAMDCARAAASRYPVAAVRLDMDEKTPHVSVFLLPMYQKDYAGEMRKSTRKPRLTISHNQVFGTPDKLSELQDWGASEMRKAGHVLERGKPKATKGKDHTTPAEGRRLIKMAEEEAQTIIRAAERTAEACIAQAEGQAAAIITKATPERFLELEKENEALQKQLTAWTAFRDLIRDKVKALFGLDGWERFWTDLNAAWKKDPRNPERDVSSSLEMKP